MNRFLIKLLALIILNSLFSCNNSIKSFSEIDKTPSITPDYSDILIPCNIAPLNFKIIEPGNSFEVRISSPGCEAIVIKSVSPTIKIDVKKWHNLLKDGKGKELYIDILSQNQEGNWQKFKTIKNKISTEKIDNHLAYRLINTGYVFWNNLGIYQRNLENFDEKPIIENKSFEYGCLNCHSFCNNDPDKMLLHIRAVHGGTIINQQGKLSKIDTKNKYTLNAGVYPSWNPDGKHIAFSVNNINQFFCSGEVRIEVSDSYSDLVIYDLETNNIITSPQVSSENRENLPTWSPDGKTLYFISAPPANDINVKIYPKYELKKIPFEAESHTWGKLEHVLSFSDSTKSISFPKISPNGKYLMFCLSDYGYFTIHHPQTDIYVLNLETGKYNLLGINSSQTESYHSFSSSGHWFVFSSKRMDGLFTRPYFSYLNDDGIASKPFVLPQEDPEFYDTFIKNYNVPELIIDAVSISPLAIRDKVLEDPIPSKIDPTVDTLYMKKHLSL